VRYSWSVVVTIVEMDDDSADRKDVVATLEGWELSDTTFYGIQADVDEVVNQLKEDKK
jgi:hypothetical protein